MKTSIKLLKALIKETVMARKLVEAKIENSVLPVKNDIITVDGERLKVIKSTQYGPRSYILGVVDRPNDEHHGLNYVIEDNHRQTNFPRFSVATAWIKATDPLGAEHPDKRNIRDLYVAAFASGDHEAYKMAMDPSHKSKFSGGDFSTNHLQTYLDVDNLQLERGEKDKPLADVSKFTKSDLICYVLAVNSAMPRNEILRQVAKIQGAPYVPTSNKSYFDVSQPSYPGAPKNTVSVIVKGLVKVVGKQGNTLVYNVTPKGAQVATKVLSVIGKDPAHKAIS